MIKLNARDQVLLLFYLTLIAYALFMLNSMKNRFLSEEQQIAYVYKMNGKNQAMSNGFLAWKNLENNDGLGAGDKVLSGDEGMVEIHLKNGLILELSPRTLITLKHDSINVEKGRVRLNTRLMRLKGTKHFNVNNVDVLSRENIETYLIVDNAKQELKDKNKYMASLYDFKNVEKFFEIKNNITDLPLVKTISKINSDIVTELQYSLNLLWGDDSLDFLITVENEQAAMFKVELLAINGKILMSIADFHFNTKYSYNLLVAPVFIAIYEDNKLLKKIKINIPPLEAPHLLTSLVRKKEKNIKNNKILGETLKVLPKIRWSTVTGARKYIVKIYKKSDDRIEEIKSFYVNKTQAIWPHSFFSGNYFYQIAAVDLYNNIGSYSKLGLMQLE